VPTRRLRTNCTGSLALCGARDDTVALALVVHDFLIQRLGQWGVKRIYGYPGDVSAQVPALDPRLLATLAVTLIVLAMLRIRPE
jgi:hypothetical protein